MDGNRFDNLSRALTRGLTRRGAVKALAAALIGGTAISTVDGADAAACKGIGASCVSGRCCARLTCDPGGRTCLGLETARGCGTNSALCRAPFVCQSNMRVVPSRTIGQTCQLRGAKNRRCADGLVCSSGRCLGLLNTTGCSTNNALCDGDLVCRVDTCLPVGALTDTCDEDDDCGDTLVCTSGACAPDCTPDCTGLVCGDDGCGGSCGTCGAYETCTSGACLCTGEVCDTVNGEGCCMGQCIDMRANFDHCGGCWASCDYGTQYCADSTCHDYCAGNVGTTRVTMENRFVTGAYESAASYNEPLAYIPGGSASCLTDADCTKCADLIGTNVTSFGNTALVTDCGCALGKCDNEDLNADRNSETCKIFHNNPTF